MKSFRFLVALSLTSLFSICSASALDAYARFEGGSVPTNGESLIQGRENWIELAGFSMGVENTINIGSSSSGGGAGKANFKEVTLTKTVDSASAPLMLSCASGSHYETVTIEFTKSGGSGAAPIVSYRMIMKSVFVESVSTSYNEGDDTMQETVVLKHGAHQITTFTQDQHGAVSQSGQYEWSIVLNLPTLDVE